MGSCNNVGLVLQKKHPTDLNQALKYFQKSCDGGLKNGCFNLSGLYLQGKGMVRKDMKKAMEYSVRSCELGHPRGCANASRMYHLGDGVSKDEKKAKKFKAHAKKLEKSTLWPLHLEQLNVAGSHHFYIPPEAYVIPPKASPEAMLYISRSIIFYVVFS